MKFHGEMQIGQCDQSERQRWEHGSTGRGMWVDREELYSLRSLISTQVRSHVNDFFQMHFKKVMPVLKVGVVAQKIFT